MVPPAAAAEVEAAVHGNDSRQPRLTRREIVISKLSFDKLRIAKKCQCGACWSGTKIYIVLHFVQYLESV